METNILIRIKEESKLAEMAERNTTKTKFKARQMKPIDQGSSYGKGVGVQYKYFVFFSFFYYVLCDIIFSIISYRPLKILF